MMHMLPRVLGCQELEAARRAQPLVFARAVERRPEVAASPTAQAYQDGMIVAGNAVRAMGNAFAFLTDGTAAVTADPEKYSGFILPFTSECGWWERGGRQAGRQAWEHCVKAARSAG